MNLVPSNGVWARNNIGTLIPLPSLKLNASSPLKIGLLHPKGSRIVFQAFYFQLLLLLVSGRVYNFLEEPPPTAFYRLLETNSGRIWVLSVSVFNGPRDFSSIGTCWWNSNNWMFLVSLPWSNMLFHYYVTLCFKTSQRCFHKCFHLSWPADTSHALWENLLFWNNEHSCTIPPLETGLPTTSSILFQGPLLCY